MADVLHRVGGKRWGDTVGSFNGTEWTPPQGSANIDDAVVAINTAVNFADVM